MGGSTPNDAILAQSACSLLSLVIGYPAINNLIIRKYTMGGGEGGSIVQLVFSVSFASLYTEIILNYISIRPPIKYHLCILHAVYSDLNFFLCASFCGLKILIMKIFILSVFFYPFFIIVCQSIRPSFPSEYAILF